MTTTFNDPEAEAVNAFAAALEPLDPDARKRVLGLAYSRYVPPPDLDGPRTYWLDEMPAEGDLLHHGGRDLEITGVRAQAVGERVEYWMATGHVPAVELFPSVEGVEA